MKSRLTLIVASIAVANSAMAQSSVTLYGIADVGLQYTSRSFSPITGNGGKLFGLTGAGYAPSIFGLKGVEDLGGGLQAEFNLESGLDLSNGGFTSSNGNLFGRLAWVGLKGGFGEVKAGLQFSPFFVSVYDTDPRGLSSFGSALGIYANNAGATGMFNQNAVSYTSPTIAGLKASAMLALGGVAGDFQSGRQYSASLRYDNGPLMLEAAYYSANPGGTVVTAVPTNYGVVGRSLGASYKFGTVTVKASVVNYNVAGALNNYVYSGGFDYLPVPFVDVNAGVYYVRDRNDSNNHSLVGALGAQYFLSRSTALYAQVGVVNNHGRETTAISTIPLPFSAVGATTVGANIGMRHVF